MSTGRKVLLALGAVLMLTVVLTVGPRPVFDAFARMSWWLPVVVVFPFVVMTVCDTLGWWFAFSRGAPRVAFHVLFGVRMAGEAFTMTTPTASIGGEAVKAWLLRPWVGLQHTVPSVIVAKTSITAAQALVLAAGLAVAWPTLPHDGTLLVAMEWLLVLEILGVVGFILVQVSGVMGHGARVLHRLMHRAGLDVSAGSETIGHVGGALERFYREEPARLLLSIVFHFLGWALGALEVALILAALGTPVPLRTAFLIEAFGTGVRFASFMVPAHLGVLEAGYVGTFVALGLAGPLGLAFSLVRRLREAAWVLLGFVALAAIRPPAGTRAADTPSVAGG